MSVLDFKEIPKAHEGGGKQDTFELLARDFFKALGYRIDSAPSRGADDGKDLILTEVRKGIAGDTEIRWLVSCKHKAHSGASVSKYDEPEINDAMKMHKCSGFIGFYSTIPSSALIRKVENMEGIQYQFFDSAVIESTLLKGKEYLDIAKRYFPISFKEWADENPSVAKIYRDHESFKCHNCNAILDRNSLAIIVSWAKYEEKNGIEIKKIRNQYVCCKGECDRKLQRMYSTDSHSDSWVDISDYFTPTLYLRMVMAFSNELYDSETEYSKEAFEQEKDFLLKAFPYISRRLTTDESEVVARRGMLPAFLGGFS